MVKLKTTLRETIIRLIKIINSLENEKNPDRIKERLKKFEKVHSNYCNERSKKRRKSCLNSTCNCGLFKRLRRMNLYSKIEDYERRYNCSLDLGPF